MMSKKHKKICTTLDYIVYLLILALAVSEYLSIFDFAFSLGIHIGITSSAVGIKIYPITAAIKKYKLIIQKKRSNMIK